KAAPTGHVVTGTPGAGALDQPMVQGAAHLFRAQLVGGAMGERRSARHSSARGCLGLGGQPFALHVVDHLGTSRGPRGSLAKRGGTDGGAHGRHRYGATLATGSAWPRTRRAAQSEALTPSGRGMTQRRLRKGGGGMGKNCRAAA